MRLFISLLCITTFFSCNNDKKIPDVSNINISLTTKRFERELFSIDSSQVTDKLDPLIAGYGSFGEIFLYNILNTDPSWKTDTTTAYINGFLSSYKNIYDTAQILFRDFAHYEKEIKYALQYLKYYFPLYMPPHTIITYIGPLDGYGDILTEDAFIIGLHQHLGKNFSLYHTERLQETYPTYITSRFEPDYIPINCMKNVINDMYPEITTETTLSLQMIEKGKRLYVLQQLLPYSEEYKLIGYTETQLKECYQHEAAIWDLFVQNNLLQITEKNMIKNYLSEGPKTQELGDASPGNIGSFAGWQMVKKFMKNNPKVSPAELMTMHAENIFEQAKYKP